MFHLIVIEIEFNVSIAKYKVFKVNQTSFLKGFYFIILII